MNATSIRPVAIKIDEDTRNRAARPGEIARIPAPQKSSGGKAGRRHHQGC